MQIIDRSGDGEVLELDGHLVQQGEDFVLLVWRKDAVKDCDADREFVERMGMGSTISASIKNLPEIGVFLPPKSKKLVFSREYSQ